jgi:serine/threonine-protein kinase
MWGPGVSIKPGQTLSHVVWKAQDTALGREVAIKFLAEAFSEDPERLSRFEREARLLASLNHPNIATIHGLEELEGIRFLVMELVDGQDLARRLAFAPLPVGETLIVGKQLAEALEAAHEHGVIHRDLKPANVKVTPDGMVKVLDFGLAKVLERTGLNVDPSLSPTITTSGTAIGVILGTAAYMSPEQARGKPLDTRTDIWSFGCVLWECLTGNMVFRGESVSDTLAAILEREPAWGNLPERAPRRLRELVRRCLQKDPHQRLRHIGDARIEIDQMLGATADEEISSAPSSSSVPVPVIRFEVTLPRGETLDAAMSPAVALSPDGARFVYVARKEGVSRLFLREMKRLEPTLIRGTQGASNPIFSPDGKWVAFFAGGRLKKVSIAGAPPRTLCDAPDHRGAAWGPDERIFFTVSPNQGLWQVPSSGGKPRVLTTPDRSIGEISHRWPEILPGGKVLLFSVKTPDIDTFDEGLVAAFCLDSNERKILVEGGSYARYSASGHLVFMRANNLMAVPFDPVRLHVKGDPVSILQDVRTNPFFGSAQITIASTGLLTYVPGGPETFERLLSLVDREGNATPLTDRRRSFVGASISPDGTRVASTLEGANVHIWIYEMERESFSRSTFEGDNVTPIWSPDGKRMAFTSDRSGTWNLFWKQVDGGGAVERLLESEHDQFPTSWSPDGRYLAFEELNPSTGFDIWVLSLEEGMTANPLVQTPFNERGAKFSSDGQWVAYYSDESGQHEVYLRAFSGPEGKWQVSTDGGTEPVWSQDGQELIYRNGSRLLAVRLQTDPFRAEKPRVLFEGSFVQGDPASPWDARSYDIFPDGQRFVMVHPVAEDTGTARINVVLNWFEELKRLVPTDE